MTRAFSICALLLHLPFATKAAVQGTFNVLSYNVAGLPEPLSSGEPAKDTPLISPRLGPFNVVHVQEDFHYHSQLYAADNHPSRTSTSGDVPFGSGLNTLSDFPFTDLKRVTWNKCFINEADCLTPKGFTFMRVRIADGAWVDFYNLHADAGDAAGDATARASNLAQVAAAINSWSPGIPVLVFGDTNLRYTASDSNTLATFVSSAGVKDLWVELQRGGEAPASGSSGIDCPRPFPAGTTQAQMDACEIVDKIFYKSSPALTLTATDYQNENLAFVDSASDPLSDHFPISGTFSWQLSSSIRLGDPSGGEQGSLFNDIPAVLADQVPRITSVTIRGGSRVDAVMFTAAYPGGATTTVAHGGSGGSPNTLTLASGERITQMRVCTGTHLLEKRVFFLKLTTNQGRTLSSGASTSTCIDSAVPTDAGVGGEWGLVAFWGRKNSEIRKLGAIWGAAY
ncbi:hypothetical protein HGRIS_012691 [Hohenbuehelia grisea]|uniref:Jacalin-type lectin domain-containing protein n=1 Tax=Hohenbuehelia grisea TaxID=104357 RepID=A0ABR3IT17_9AGAR